MITLDNNSLNIVLTLIIFVSVLAFCFLAIFNTSKSKANIIPLCIFFALIFVSYILSLWWAFIFSTVFAGIYVTICLVANIDGIKKFIKHPIKGLNYKDQVKGVEKIFDIEAFYDTITKAVLSFSNSKTGALITFEKDDSLDKYIDANGVRVNAPLSYELLQTIFYVGTRLHDGGLIIKDNMIEAAAVTYPLDDSFYLKKYGMRHRAAMGISKATDSITVVVSEETGRISIASKGELQTVSQYDFRTVFENYMSEDNA